MQDKQFSSSKRLKIHLTILPEERISIPNNVGKTTGNLSDTEVDVLEAVVREDLSRHKQIGTNDFSVSSSYNEKVVGDIINTLLEF